MYVWKKHRNTFPSAWEMVPRTGWPSSLGFCPQLPAGDIQEGKCTHGSRVQKKDLQWTCKFRAHQGDDDWGPGSEWDPAGNMYEILKREEGPKPGETGMQQQQQQSGTREDQRRRAPWQAGRTGFQNWGTMIQFIEQKTCTWVLATVFTTAKMWNNHSVLQQERGQTDWAHPHMEYYWVITKKRLIKPQKDMEET